LVKVRVKLVKWSDVVGWCKELARIVKESGYKPDIIVAVARGGYAPARLLCDLLDIHDLVSIQVLHWGRAAEITAKAHVKYPLEIDLSGKRVLLVDDICDTGESLIVARDYILEKCKPADLKIAVMQWISPVAKMKPDFYVEDVKEWVWYQYPWCRTEDTTNFLEKMLKEEGKARAEWTLDEIKEKFREWYGIQVDDEYYLLALDKLAEEGLVEKVEREGKVVYRVKASQ